MQIAKLIQTVRCIDLTTLAGDDTEVNCGRLCCRASAPLNKRLILQLRERQFLDDNENVQVGAVCVYPARAKDCAEAFKKLQVTPLNIAAVATGFPSGQYGLTTRIQEIAFATTNGANEIDVVINRALALAGDWKGVYDEVSQMRAECDKGNAHLKVILAVGELGSLENVYKASMASMLAGADFIKTSTGKETINATIPVGIVMTRAISDFYRETGIKVGFKPAGGIKSANDAILWLKMIKTELGDTWISPHLFRFGASSLLNEVEKELFVLLNNRNPYHYEVSL